MPRLQYRRVKKYSRNVDEAQHRTDIEQARFENRFRREGRVGIVMCHQVRRETDVRVRTAVGLGERLGYNNVKARVGGGFFYVDRLRLCVAEEAEAAALVGRELDDFGNMSSSSVTEVDIGTCSAGGDVGDAMGVLGVAFGYDPGATLAGACGSGSGSSGSSSSGAGDVHVRGHPDELDVWLVWLVLVLGLGGELGADGWGRGGEGGGALAVGPGRGRVIDRGVA